MERKAHPRVGLAQSTFPNDLCIYHMKKTFTPFQFLQKTHPIIASVQSPESHHLNQVQVWRSLFEYSYAQTTKLGNLSNSQASNTQQRDRHSKIVIDFLFKMGENIWKVERSYQSKIQRDFEIQPCKFLLVPWLDSKFWE